MPNPTFTSITPQTGGTGGMVLVRIDGTNFRVQDPAPPFGPTLAQGPTTSLKPSVQVLFGNAPATDVQVISSTVLYARTPLYQGDPVDGQLPPTDITIKNLDNNGVPIGGEQVTVIGAFTYKRPVIHGTPNDPLAGDSPYTLVSHGLVMLLRRQVISNVALTTHVDYAEPGVVTINIAKVPALVVQGPTIVRDLEYWHNEPRQIDNGDGSFSIGKPPFVARMTYTLVGISDNEREIINIIGSLQTCFEKVKHLPVDLDPTDPTAGRVFPVLQLTAPPQTTNAPSDSNIRTFVAVCEVRGVEVFETDAQDRAYVATESTLEAQEFSGVTVEAITLF